MSATVGSEFGDDVLASRFEEELKMEGQLDDFITVFMGFMNPKVKQQPKCEKEGAEEASSMRIIPGLTDHVTATQIFTRVPWPFLRNLSLVSRAWRRAFESRFVYDYLGPPVRCDREAFLVTICRHPMTPPERDVFQLVDGDGDEDSQIPRLEEYAISVYDSERDVWNFLPDLPNGTRGRSVPFQCAWAMLDCKLYVLGGEDEDQNARADVYMLDFASCKRVWHTCAKMSRPRCRFACHALDGKLYALGGSSSLLHKYSKEAEVYDPEKNAWSPIADMLHHHIYHSVVSLGGELYVQGGVTVHEMSPDGLEVVSDGLPNFVETYNPRTNKWKKISNFDPTLLDLSFEYLLVVVNDRLYKLKPGLRVCSYDILCNSWEDLDINVDLPEGLCDFGDNESFTLYAAVVLGAEVFVMISGNGFDNYSTILRSKGFSSNEGYIVWENVSCPRPYPRDFQLLEAFEL